MTTAIDRLAATGLGALALLALTQQAIPAGSAGSGVYRPVEGQNKRGSTQGQFPPASNRGNQRWSPAQTLPSPTLPATPRPGYNASGYGQPTYGGYPQAGYGTYGYSPYAPGGYGTYGSLPATGYAAPPPPPPAPGYDTNRNGYGLPLPNPGSFMDNFFGGNKDDRPPAYLPPPAPPLTAPVAPVYSPPVPQPPTTLPATPSAPVDTIEVPSPEEAPPHAQFLGQKRKNENQDREKIKPAPQPPSPRPYSNPQETGNAFPLRGSSQAGGSDSRFRPPELKGTP
jgi:hypothetical protein